MTTAAPKTRTLSVNPLARVEGEAALTVKLKAGHAPDVKLRIFEPPRFFEAFLRGRHFSELPDLVARICGICPIAYQMSAVHAIENALSLPIDPAVRLLRRLFYCGEWIESHTLHVFFLHTPDFLGYPSLLDMARDHPDLAKQALRLKKIGNQLVILLGGREIHPVSAAVGGFYKVPTEAELQSLVPDLQWALDASLAAAKRVAAFSFPDFQVEYEFVALSHPSEYPLNQGRLVSNKGLDIPVVEFDKQVVEHHVRHSNALHSTLRGRGSYLTGPLARFNLNFPRLPGFLQQLARECGLSVPCRNPFQSITVRCLEIAYACTEALRIIGEYRQPATPRVPVTPHAASGCAATEAPRGTLYHHYEIDDQGFIRNARIVPPTSQNLKRIEADLAQYIPPIAGLPGTQLTALCERAIRNYDPCISCATHFLKLDIESS